MDPKAGNSLGVGIAQILKVEMCKKNKQTNKQHQLSTTLPTSRFYVLDLSNLFSQVQIMSWKKHLQPSWIEYHKIEKKKT
jgi:hypothetical protein